MKKLFRFAVLMLGVTAFLGLAARVQAQYYWITAFVYETLNNETTVVITNASGNVTFSGQYGSGGGHFTTDANGLAILKLTPSEIWNSQYNMDEYIVEGTCTVTITNMPGGLLLQSNTISQSIYQTAIGEPMTGGSVDDFYVFGPLTGQVLSDGLGVNNVTVSGYLNGQTTTDTNGNFNLGLGEPQTVSVSKTGVSFSAAQQTNYPGTPLIFTVTSGTISGQISGPGGNGATLWFVDYLGSYNYPVTANSSGAYTSYAMGAFGSNDYLVVSPWKYGYHFTPPSISDLHPGESLVNFASSSTPPSIASIPSLTFLENLGPFTNLTSTFITYGDVPDGDVALSATSSNPALIPNAPVSINVVDTSQFIVLTPIPGATGSTVISLFLNDGINPIVSNNFTVTVNSHPQLVAGMPWALNFDGVNNEVVVSNFANTAPTSEVTVEFWANFQGIAQQFALVLAQDNGLNRFAVGGPWGKPGNYGTYGYGNFYWDFGNLNGTGRLSYPLQSSVIGQWTHFAFVSSQASNIMQMYINGILVAYKTGGGSFTNYPDNLLIGSPYVDGFRGALSDLRIWNVALSASNILQTMNNPLVGNEPGLVLYYRFNEDSGLTIHDSSPTALNGTIEGDAPYPTWSPPRPISNTTSSLPSPPTMSCICRAICRTTRRPPNWSGPWPTPTISKER